MLSVEYFRTYNQFLNKWNENQLIHRKKELFLDWTRHKNSKQWLGVYRKRLLQYANIAFCEINLFQNFTKELEQFIEQNKKRIEYIRYYLERTKKEQLTFNNLVNIEKQIDYFRFRKVAILMKQSKEEIK